MKNEITLIKVIFQSGEDCETFTENMFKGFYMLIDNDTIMLNYENYLNRDLKEHFDNFKVKTNILISDLQLD